MLDWDHLHSFLLIARSGSLSSAAQAARVSQSTMGRRLEALHADAGVRLLLKTPSGYALTKAGEQVVASVERMEQEALSVERAVLGQDDQVGGEVKITTVESLGANVVAGMLQPLLDRHATLQVEVSTDYRNLSLSRREADVALRLAEFQQQEAVVRRVGALSFGLFASRAYLDAHGAPDLETGATGHRLVTCQPDLDFSAEAQRLRALAPAARIAVRANSRYVQVQAVRGGCGLGLLPCYLASGVDELVEVDPPRGRISRDLWLGVHRDVRDAPRIRLVVDQLTAELRTWAPRLAPGDAAPVFDGEA